ncbi:MAG: glucose-6-phosphate dehydrogenase [Firmicutes bacterium]|nr:glucose-6-phosphate dehydrogenase [Bacillota bacterium]
MTTDNGFEDVRQPDAHTLILFGATGDLARRKLFPALLHLDAADMIAPGTRVIAIGRRPFDEESFRTEVEAAIHEFGRSGEIAKDIWTRFLSRIFYCPTDVESIDDFRRMGELANKIEEESGTHNRLFYLAMAPEFFGPVGLRLREAGLTEAGGWRRLVIEKPFGHDHASAQLLNDELCQVFAEEEIFRIDHYLGKEMVQNIEVLRFANSVFEPVWNNRSIANVQITSSETVGVEERAPYYEHAGALRDMVQNHMLQMIMMIAMEPPSRLKTEAIRDEKVKVLRSLRRYTPAEAARHVVRGQYLPGAVDGKSLAGYTNEPRVAADSRTETFIAAELFVDNFRWAGVPFYIRTGKRMALKSTEIVIQFRDMPKHLYFNQNGSLGPNLLVIRVNPVEGMYIQLNAKRPGTDGTVIPVAMEFSQPSDHSPEAYERLFLDAMRGDSTFFTRWDEVSLAWKFVDPIAEAFQHEETSPLNYYRAGSWGPKAADDLIRRAGDQWWPVFGQDTPSVESYLERKLTQAKEMR